MKAVAATYPNGVFAYPAPPLAALPSEPPAGTYTPATYNDEGIQAAIDAASANGGGTVSLLSGVYTVNHPVRLASNIRLFGQGNEVTFIRRGSGFAYQTGTTNLGWVGLLFSSNDALHDVTIADLSVDGALSASQREASQSFIGIFILSDSTNASHNLRIHLSDIEVKNCGHGVHMKGTTDITLSNGKYHDNGGGNLLFHNIYFRRAGNVTLNGVSSYNSGGHGFKFCGGTTYHTNESKNLTITGCDMKNNGYTDLYLTGVKGARITDNTLNYGASDYVQTPHVLKMGGAIMLNSESGMNSSMVDIVNNRVQNNYANGIYVHGTDSCCIQGNYCNSNPTNYNIHGSGVICDYNTFNASSSLMFLLSKEKVAQ